MATKRTIVVSGEGLRYEWAADAAISPGDLIKQTTTPGCIRHATAGQRTAAIFAIENEVFGKGVDVDYAQYDRVLCEAVYEGTIVHCTIAAAAAAIIIGDFLESAGDGTLRKTTTVANAIAVADEALDNSAGATKQRIRARIM